MRSLPRQARIVWFVTLLGAALLLLALNLASEFVSFGRVIGAVAPLRGFDRLGRRPAP